jgi:hypothetical protein
MATAADQTPPAGVEKIEPEPEKRAPTEKVVAKRSLWPLALLGIAIVAVFGYTQWPREPAIEKLEAPPEPPVVVQEEPKIVEPPVVIADAAVPDAPPPKVVDKKPPKQIDKPPPPVVVEQKPKRKVTLNTSPQWSWFTVDNDPTKYQTPGTIELTEGPHTIRFSGNEYFPADKSITIDVKDKDVMKAVKLAD